MSEAQVNDGTSTPPCPLCSAMSRIKELWQLQECFHFFFKCVECETVYPVIRPKEDD